MGAGVGVGGPGSPTGGEAGITTGLFGGQYGGSNVFGGAGEMGGFGQSQNIQPMIPSQIPVSTATTDPFVAAMTIASQRGEIPSVPEAPSGQLVSEYIGQPPIEGKAGFTGNPALPANWNSIIGAFPSILGGLGGMFAGPFGGILGGFGGNALAALLGGKGLESGVTQGGLGLPAAFASQAGSGIGSAFGPFGALAGSLLAGNLIGDMVAQGLAGNLGEAVAPGTEGADFTLPEFSPGPPVAGPQMGPTVEAAQAQQAAAPVEPPSYSLSPTPFAWYGMKRVNQPWVNPPFGGNYGGMKRVNE